MAADAVLLIAFGGPTRPEEVAPFLANVVRGRGVPPERLAEVARHYHAIGGRSPLNPITFNQAEKLRVALAEAGAPLPVYVGMRNWEPYVADTLARMADEGRHEAIGLILAPHATEASRARYTDAVGRGAAALGTRAPVIRWAPDWHTHPRFIAAAAELAATAIARLPADRRAAAVLVFTAHSVPRAMAAGSPYEAEIAASARAVAERLGHRAWQIAYQSRSGGSAEPWLEPDVNDALRALAAAGARDAVLVAIGFVADHVEVLYDLDVEAAATAHAAGLGFVRAPTVNDHPLFIRMLADVVREAAR
ncbi:MAG: ferrochelatase [Deltaproteobacteria bacterium]|nr:MAG: ferrochelatase [Deltaproteobacteria bacterium]TMB45701.1 MAG: ferrochelatase [Deltaproteobacteria bacterium]